jgi:translation initiation factor IF-3
LKTLAKYATLSYTIDG